MEGIVHFLRYIEEFNEVSVLIRLVLATIMGSLIGMERGANKQVAGMRTFALVCVGSALAQIVDIHCITMYGSGDPVRLAQGVINGIGFLGVGTIVVTGKTHIKGLTTAATLWTTAVIGISVGAGYIYGSVVTFVLIMFVIMVMAHISRHQDKFNRDMELMVEFKGEEGVDNLMSYIKDKGYRICSMSRKVSGEYVSVELRLDLNKKVNHELIITDITQIKSITSVEEIVY